MIDPVDRGAVIDELRACTIEAATLYGTNDALKTAFKESLRGINDLPNVEAERKRGRWIDREENMEGMTLMIKLCSECGASKPMKIFSLEDYKFNFCPSCGAQMEKGGKDE